MEDMQRLQSNFAHGTGTKTSRDKTDSRNRGREQQGTGARVGADPVTIALGSIKQVLHRVGRTSQGQGQQGRQGQQQGQQGQGGQGQQGQGRPGFDERLHEPRQRPGPGQDRTAAATATC